MNQLASPRVAPLPSWGVAACAERIVRGHSDERGAMCFVEGQRDLGFAIARSYWLFASQPNQLRGAHAHRALRQLYVAVAGRLEVVLRDPHQTRRIVLAAPNQGLYVAPMTWRHVENISSDAVLLVLASADFAEDDYLRDFDAYLAVAGAIGAA